MMINADECRVSVVMATYNGKKYLAEQLNSILQELLPGDELIVIDDASTDDSIDIVKSYNSNYIKIFKNSHNSGVFETFERGLRLAENEYIFLSDQDDVWISGKRSAFVSEFAKNPAVSVAISDAILIDGEGAIISESFMKSRHGFRGDVLSTIWRNRYLGCSMAVRRSMLPLILPFPSYIPMHDMWIGALASMTGKVAYIEKPYLFHRRHSSNASPSSRQSWWQMLRWRVALSFGLLARYLFTLGRG